MEGTALSERDLQRSRAESASAVFLLADRFSPNYQQEDLNVQFQVNTITKCLQHEEKLRLGFRRLAWLSWYMSKSTTSG